MTHSHVASDIEIDYKTVNDALMHIVDYGNGVTVATTRPDTIPYDVAVAVHSADERYTGVASVIHPLTGLR
jgi:valyl-tRNA synthetase